MYINNVIIKQIEQLRRSRALKIINEVQFNSLSRKSMANKTFYHLNDKNYVNKMTLDMLYMMIDDTEKRFILVH